MNNYEEMMNLKQEELNLRHELFEAKKNLTEKCEIIAALETLILTKGTEEMKNELILTLGKLFKKEV